MRSELIAYSVSYRWTTDSYQLRLPTQRPHTLNGRSFSIFTTIYCVLIISQQTRYDIDDS